MALDRLWNPIAEALFGATANSVDQLDDVRARAQVTAPVVWLLGKTGAGKTAIISALTGDTRAAIGEGFAPCTRTAAFYDVPAEAPLLRFLDTRGLGEVDYDPAADIAWCEGRAHLLLVAMQVADPAQESVLRVVRLVRRRHSEWPVVVAQTGLHRLYHGGTQHPASYPFTGSRDDEYNASIPHLLRQALRYQRGLFAGLRGLPPLFVPIDFTLPEDGYPPAEFGLEALWSALEVAGPRAFEALHRARADAENDAIRARARPLIYGHSAASAGAGAVPIPFVGVGGLAGSLALMLTTLSGRYGLTWTRATFAQFSGTIGGGALVWWGIRYGFRELLKLVPVIGTATAGALNAASAFAITVAVGEAACVWLGYRRRGLNAPGHEVRRAFADGLAAGLRQAKSSNAKPSGAHG